MRVPNKSIYDASKLRLGQLTERLKTANEVVSTGKRINRMSDDPIGLTQVLSLKSSISNLKQIDKNLTTGKMWLDGAESTLTSTEELISDMRTLGLNMVNGSVNATNRRDAVETVNSIIEEMVLLGNVQVNGNYIFAGTRLETKPFVFDDATNPTRVEYQGTQTPFAIRSDKTADLAVGRNGKADFWEETVTINETNNKIDFIEHDPSRPLPSLELTATVASGKYRPEELAVAMQNAMNNASASENGYDLTYEVAYDTETRKFTIQDDGSVAGAHVEILWGTGTHAGTKAGPLVSDQAVTELNIGDHNNTFQLHEDVGSGFGAPLTITISNGDYADGHALAQAVQDAMNNVSGGRYRVTYNEDSQRIHIHKENSSDLRQFRILWRSDADTNTAGTALGFIEDDTYPLTANTEYSTGTSIAPEIGFAARDVRDALVGESSLTFPVTIDATSDTIDLTENLGLGPVARTATIAAGTYNDGTSLAAAVQTAMNSSVPASTVSYSVSFDTENSKLVIAEAGEPQLKELQMLWASNPSGNSAGNALGFLKDRGLTPPASDEENEWGIFNTLFDLKEYLAANDVDGISRSLTRLESHFEHFSSSIADVGQKAMRVEVKSRIVNNLSISYTERRATIEEADYIEAVMELKSREMAYEAALSSSARVLQLSLLDYM